ncbi:hypothetical protein ACJX0J_039448, partial [Zea mays]
QQHGCRRRNGGGDQEEEPLGRCAAVAGGQATVHAGGYQEGHPAALLPALGAQVLLVPPPRPRHRGRSPVPWRCRHPGAPERRAPPLRGVAALLGGAGQRADGRLGHRARVRPPRLLRLPAPGQRRRLRAPLRAAHALLRLEVQPPAPPRQHRLHGERRGVRGQDPGRAAVVHAARVRQPGRPAGVHRAAAHPRVAALPGVQPLRAELRRPLHLPLRPLQPALHGPGARPGARLRRRHPGRAAHHLQALRGVRVLDGGAPLRRAGAHRQRAVRAHHVPAPHAPGAAALRLQRVGLAARRARHHGPRLRPPQPRAAQRHRHPCPAPHLPQHAALPRHGGHQGHAPASWRVLHVRRHAHRQGHMARGQAVHLR